MTIQTIEKGRIGELQTRRALKLLLDESQYHIINNLLISSGIRTTQIDHIVISRYGIFVVETKYTNFWIYGGPNEEQWTEVFYKKKNRFPNPLRQNFAHTRALAEFLKIDDDKIFSLVVFWGDCQFETNIPSNVVKGIRMVDYIKSKKQILFPDDKVENIYNDLVTLILNTPISSMLRHIDSVKKRYESNTVCPKCGGLLRERTAHTGKVVGHVFLGCANYPHCRYTKEL